MPKTQSTKTLQQAFIAASVELKNPDTDSQGYGYKYASLPKILDQVKPVLKKHGLAVIQLPIEAADGHLAVKTVLMHESGESIESVLSMPVPEIKGANATQKAGGAITYIRRYALTSMLNIAADEDTDAAKQQEPRRKEYQPAQPKQQPVKKEPEYLTSAQLSKLTYLCTQVPGSAVKIREAYKIKSVGELTKAQASSTIDQLNAKIAKDAKAKQEVTPEDVKDALFDPDEVNEVLEETAKDLIH